MDNPTRFDSVEACAAYLQRKYGRGKRLTGAQYVEAAERFVKDLRRPRLYIVVNNDKTVQP